MASPGSDVCLILEGTYPYVTGGVSTWTHDLISAHKDLTFSLLTILPPEADLTIRYAVPDNVVEQKRVFLQRIPAGGSLRDAEAFCHAIEQPMIGLQSGGGYAELEQIFGTIWPVRDRLGSDLLLDSPAAWNLLTRMYRTTHSSASFLDYFWSWRSLMGGLLGMLVCELPAARVYHTICTGYAGLVAARAKMQTGRPVLLTEHGIYTNERRVEIGLADWLHDRPTTGLNVVRGGAATLKDLWIDTFVGYSRACYAAADKIITLYSGNQEFQLNDGAAPGKLRVIPNGIDLGRYHGLRRDEAHRPTVAFIGRVVPIKDVKTFIRSIAILRTMVPEVEALIMGPTDEDPEYFSECEQMVRHFDLGATVTFTGRVKPLDYFPRVDVMVLTSISEAQPLTILEAGAAAIPSVATDVGACREMILGAPTETPALGSGGAVTPLCNPSATAAAMARLLTDPEWRARCGSVMQERVRRFYDKRELDRTYRELYEECRAMPDVTSVGSRIAERGVA